MPDSSPGAAFWEALGWTPQPSQQNQLQMLQEQLREWNSRVNLTRLVDGNDYWINQVFDRPLAAANGTGHPPSEPTGH